MNFANINYKRLLVVFLLLLMTALPTLPSVGAVHTSLIPVDQDHLYLKGNSGSIAISLHASIFYDDNSRITIQDAVNGQVNFTAISDTKQLNPGYYQGSVWLRTELTNIAEQTVNKTLRFDYANLDKVWFYAVDADQQIIKQAQSGVHVANSQRSIGNRHAAFNVTIEPLETVVLYTKVKSNGSVTLFQQLLSTDQFQKQDSQELFWLSAYCGMLLALGLYNLLLFAVLREPAFGFYSLFALSFLSATLCLNGMGPQLFWDHQQLNVNRMMAFSFCAAGFTATLFLRSLLKLKDNSPSWFRLTYIPLAVSGLGMLLAPWVDPRLALQLSDVNGLVAGVVLLSCGLCCAWQKIPGAKLFVIAWTVLLAGATLHAMRNLGVLPTHFFTLYGMQIGSALEMVLLSFAIAFRFNQLKRDKERAQDKMLTSLRTHEEQLEQKVERRTHQLEQMAKQDALTGLLNRNGLHQALTAALQRCQHEHCGITLFMLDLNDFKHVNDEHGHSMGDIVLSQTAMRIQQATRDYDVAARFGGDEFIIVSESLTNDADIEDFIQQLQTTLAEPIPLDNQRQLQISASIGYYHSEHWVSVNELLKKADEAMYKVKRQQRSASN